MERKTGTVCVIGGAGYLGSWLIMRLLERGYSVQATVRLDPASKKDTSHLRNLPGASQRLKIFNADLNRPETFIPAIEGCDGVFHTAHPIDLEGDEATDDMINMAVQGVVGILKACLKSETVKRVVYTSSIGTLLYNKDHVTEFDEKNWTDIDLMRSMKVPGSAYTIPKTLAEQAALKFGEETQLEVLTILPSLIVGPFICPHFPTSNDLALALIMGNKDQYKYLSRAHMVHVDDVISGHIYLLESPEAKGRYICSSTGTNLPMLVQFLSTRYPEYRIPMNLVKELDEVKPFQLNCRKLLDLGFSFKNGLEEMYDGAIQSCKDKGFL